jgi:hypothetical protein
VTWFAEDARGEVVLVHDRETRREHNQHVFREANERLLDVIRDDTSGERPVPFLCECADDSCLATVAVKVSQWEVVASQENHFLMNVGHELSEGEEVVGFVAGYEIARKPD